LRAGNRTGLGDCQSKGRCLSRISGERPKQTRSDRSHPAMAGPGGGNPGREKGITTPPTRPLCPPRLLPRRFGASPKLIVIPKGTATRGFQRLSRSSLMLRIVKVLGKGPLPPWCTESELDCVTRRARDRRPEKVEFPAAGGAESWRAGDASRQRVSWFRPRPLWIWRSDLQGRNRKDSILR
jgi:hypothetical protein